FRMSSLKKAIKQTQRVHRERAQPEARKHLGALEKKKDYKKRAADFSEKAATLKKLKKHAMDKNPDEYHHHMVNSHTEFGKHFEDNKKTDETELQKKLGSIRDLEYVKYHLHRERKKIDEMKSGLHLADSTAGGSKHTVFVDDEEQARSFDPCEYLDTDEALLGRAFNRPKGDQLVTNKIKGAACKADVKAADSLRRTQYKELRKRMHREKELSVVVDKLELKKALAASAGCEVKPKMIKKGKSDKAAVYKWTYIRKR
ncbi:hypothetical protein PFISCL1PPCAC_12319, partial [Pristionchus fissidentatus]